MLGHVVADGCRNRAEVRVLMHETRFAGNRGFCRFLLETARFGCHVHPAQISLTLAGKQEMSLIECEFDTGRAIRGRIDGLSMWPKRID
jgi:hypothetical protein